ncbi:hypothetical protein TRIUR3_12698 [Triticum urartu]|uniref:Uncharacterized protein n=2 Tax=Triticum TaxID=4564 RepID=A0A9R0ZQ23_TRITD|nr:hypothetical protein TRIUR3_12698 [Triticum urartu]VAI80811.1 unnamed protein product [Triticum turgidum subsp. durum]
MATGGGVVLNLRVPSASAAPARRCDNAQENSIDFERINAAYQRVMSNMREAEARLEYWRRRYGLADEDLDRYRRYLKDDDEDDWFSDF